MFWSYTPGWKGALLVRNFENTGTCQAQDWKVNELRESNCSLLSWTVLAYCPSYSLKKVARGQYISLLPLQRNNILCTFWTQGFGIQGILVSYTCGVSRPAAFEILSVFLPDITSFVFIFFEHTFFFYLILKLPVSQEGPFFPKHRVLCNCFLHMLHTWHLSKAQKKILFQKSSSKLNSQLVSFALCSCYAPKSLRDLVSWTQSVLWKHCQKLPNNSSLSLIIAWKLCSRAQHAKLPDYK